MARPSYPNFPFPFYRNRSYNYPPSHMNTNPYYTNNYNSSMENSISSFSNTPSNHTSSDESENSRNFKQKNKSNKNNDDYLFDLFGLKIFSDDVLLVSLIYFLYSEGVKDDSLFLVLVLLLLS